ncbi:hypothetical protein CTheo_2059 [Ceratobasidium theobromae]|uniref:Copia protein n=1 Tax=Ceratobasidium theobromae TaxID=1582974 RepID=A0A5N5QTS9_9AGAM|nr:hypothetical protein CTheo_2059 [Ceratobasidium theobromae]
MSIRQFLDDLGVAYESGVPSPILCDNQAAIESVHNPTHKTRAKHIDIAFNFIRDEIHEGTISVSYVPTNDNLADVLTKPLNTIKHHRLGGSILVLLYLINGLFAIDAFNFFILYGSISLVDFVTLDVMGNPSSLVSTNQCCTTIVRQPLLASLVFQLRIELKPEPWLDSDWNPPSSVITPIGTMLHQLPNLIGLELQVLGAPLTRILSDCPFSLRTFSCDTCDPRPLHQFFTEQPELTELHLVGPTQPVGSFFLNHHHAVNLRKVSGTLDVVASIVGGRPIEEIKIVDVFLNTEMLRTRINFLAASISTIKVFRVVTLICQSSMIEVIAKHLPEIEVLGLHVQAPSDPHISYVNLLDSMAPIIAMLPCLEKLDVCGTDEYEHELWLEHLTQEQQLLQTWSSMSNILSYVRFPTGAEWLRHNGAWTYIHTTSNLDKVEL